MLFYFKKCEVIKNYRTKQQKKTPTLNKIKPQIPFKSDTVRIWYSVTLNKVSLTLSNIPSPTSAFFYSIFLVALPSNKLLLLGTLWCLWGEDVFEGDLLPWKFTFSKLQSGWGEDLLTWNLNAGGPLRNVYIVLIYWCSALMGGTVMEGRGNIFQFEPKVLTLQWSVQHYIIVLCWDISRASVAVLLRHPLKSVLRNAREMIRWIILSESTRIDHSEFAFSYSSQVGNLIF